MDAKQFGPRLKELREAKGLTQKQLSEGAGVSVRQLSRLESGENDATWPVVVKLCDALGIDCTAFHEEPAGPAQEPRRGRPKAQGGKSGNKNRNRKG